MKKEMTYDRARELISAWGITEDLEELVDNPDLILVIDVQEVIHAILTDTQERDEEDVYQFLDRHGIKWM